MHTFFRMPRLLNRDPRHGDRATGAPSAQARAARLNGLTRPHGHTHKSPATGEEGFLLVEVIVSALIVALIVVATFNGFDVVNRVSADQRHHDQAAQLAAQSQEQLRSDPASVLEPLQTSSHVYSQTIGGTTFTVTQSAKFINDSKQSSGCSATTAAESGSKHNGDYLQVSSAVTWPQLTARTKRPEVVQSSIITPPTGSALEVVATNGASTEAGVANVQAVVKYNAVETEALTTLEGTTGTAGCLVFGGIPATSATVEVKPPLNYVTPSGAFKVAPKEVEIAPNITTHESYKFAEGGAIKVEFEYEKLTKYEGKEVVSDTFVAANNKMLVAPEFMVGSTKIEYEAGGEERYTALTGSPAATATTAVGTNYSHGDLFPFTQAWSVYAGDCVKNSPAAGANPEKIEPVSAVVTAGKTTTVKVPLSRITLNVYKGTTEGEGLTAEALPARVTNTECVASSAPNDAVKLNAIHEQKTTTTGHLEYPLQPFGSFTLCVYSAKEKKNYTVKYVNETKAGPTRKIFLKGSTTGEQTVTANPAEPC
jgi:Tfp pilus assembly protein PilV